MSLPLHYYYEPTVCVVNHATIPLGCDLRELCFAAGRFWIEHVGPAWSTFIQGVEPGEVRPGEWPLYLFDHSDQARALGYHAVGLGGIPWGKVFVADAIKNDGSIAPCFSHELIEMVLDPWCNRLYQLPGGVSIAVEPADPVQGPTIEVDGFQMANFVYPAWYQVQHKGYVGPYDRLNQCIKPFDLLPDGFFSYNLPGDSAWRVKHGSLEGMQKFADRKGEMSRPAMRSRHFRGDFAEGWRAMQGYGNDPRPSIV